MQQMIVLVRTTGCDHDLFRTNEAAFRVSGGNSPNQRTLNRSLEVRADIRTDRMALPQIARRELKLAKPEETIYVLPASEQTTTRRSSADK